MSSQEPEKPSALRVQGEATQRVQTDWRLYSQEWDEFWPMHSEAEAREWLEDPTGLDPPATDCVLQKRQTLWVEAPWVEASGLEDAF